MRNETHYILFDAAIIGLVLDAALAVFGGLTVLLFLIQYNIFGVAALFGIVMLLVLKAFVYKNL